ncbi:MAG: autotransporter outer membrane beta-barrel domain-containing protein [Magnetococcales bacterium]|nr:autotransporter outer membrane beta-barrel domain-containing protein [Magnetococcales bacterium]
MTKLKKAVALLGVSAALLVNVPEAGATSYTYAGTGETLSWSTSSTNFSVTGNMGSNFTYAFNPSYTQLAFSGSVYTGSSGGVVTIPSGCYIDLTNYQLSSACTSALSGIMSGSNTVSSSSVGGVSEEERKALQEYSTTAAPAMRAETKATVTQISNRVSTIMRPAAFSKQKTAQLQLHNEQMGLSSGSAPAANRFGVWGNTRYINSQNTFSASKYDGSNISWLVGADFRPIQSLLVGMTASKDHAEFDLASQLRESDTTTVTPYVGYMFSNNFGIDALFGYAWLNNTQTAKTGFPLIGTYPDAERWFGSVSANGFLPLGNDWLASGKLAYMYSRENPDTGNAIKLGQVSVGAELSYLTSFAEPYLGVTYAYDTTTSASSTVGVTNTSDRDDYRWAAGVRANFDASFKGDIALEKTVGRQRYEETSVTANLRYEF